MAPGLPLPTALKAIRGVYDAIKANGAALEDDVEKFRLQKTLPDEMARWAYAIICRTQTCFDVFANTMTYQTSGNSALLEELYPGQGNQGNLVQRLESHMGPAQQLVQEASDAFERMKMLSDGYLLHLPRAEQLELEREYPELELDTQDLVAGAASVLSQWSRWENCFKAVFTEEGRSASTLELEGRQRWTAVTFSSLVRELVNQLYNVSEKAKAILRDVEAAWTHDWEDLFNRTGTHLRFAEFHATLHKYTELSKLLTEQAQCQARLLKELRNALKVARTSTTMLMVNVAGESAPFVVRTVDVPVASQYYEAIWHKSYNLGLFAQQTKDKVQKFTVMLQKARDSV